MLEGLSRAAQLQPWHGSVTASAIARVAPGGHPEALARIEALERLGRGWSAVQSLEGSVGPAGANFGAMAGFRWEW